MASKWLRLTPDGGGTVFINFDRRTLLVRTRTRDSEPFLTVIAFDGIEVARVQQSPMDIIHALGDELEQPAAPSPTHKS